ncbi:unnamed protein product [Plutella xylostella]|uniref:(diamondback moth) hypothetical protein n=1 Tax=Plutella xylostella TaxID=51655 RepID=A0A8S4ET24_PLUXY|nr:unnamed protein product [Plutella xylostella]
MQSSLSILICLVLLKSIYVYAETGTDDLIKEFRESMMKQAFLEDNDSNYRTEDGEFDLKHTIKDKRKRLDQHGKHYEHLVPMIKKIRDHIRDPDNLDQFIASRGLENFFVNHLDIKHSGIRKELLQTLKLIFDLSPALTRQHLPEAVSESLVDIFETDDDLECKGLVLEILYSWLPENPHLQAKIIDYKGLDPFYMQITNLSADVIYTMLDLFNRILKEHLKGISNLKDLGTVGEGRDLLKYLATPKTCIGLFNVFEISFVYSTLENKLMVPVFQLMQSVAPICSESFARMSKSRSLFKDLLGYISKDVNKAYYKNLNINVTAVQDTVKGFLRKKHGRIEL